MYPSTLAALGVKIDGDRWVWSTNLFSGKENLVDNTAELKTKNWGTFQNVPLITRIRFYQIRQLATAIWIVLLPTQASLTKHLQLAVLLASLILFCQSWVHNTLLCHLLDVT